MEELSNEIQSPVERLKEYFANKPKDEIVSELKKRIQDYHRHIRTCGKLARWEKSYRYYYGTDNRGFSTLGIQRFGPQGALYSMRVNHYRSLVESILTLTTSEAPAYEIQSRNTDYKSQSQTIIGSALLDYYVKEKSLGSALKESAEYGLVFDEGFLYSPWRKDLGDDYAVDPAIPQMTIKTGDIDYCAKAPIDVIRDIKGRNANYRWVIIRSWISKYELAASYPEHIDQILSQTSALETEEKDSFLLEISSHDELSESDLIPIYEFYHESTKAVPEGRYIKFVGDEILEDSTLEDEAYPRIPLTRIAAANKAFTIHGHSSQVDLLAIQEAIDQIYSTILTNQSTFGVQNIWKKRGDGINKSILPGGLNVLESEEKPEALNLTQTPAEIFNFLNHLEGVLEKLSNVNSTVRGDPSSNLKSGAALALVASQTLQLLAGITNAYEGLFESVGTLTFQVLQKRAKTPRLVAIVGKHNSSYLESFTSDDISNVVRVVVDKGNPLTKTTAGRVELANSLLETGLIQSPQEYLSVVQTGKLEPLTEAPMATLLNIRAENEALKAGRPVKALRGDDHKLHIAEHKAIIASPEARANPELLRTTLAHIEEHEQVEIMEMQRQQQLQMQMQAPPQQQQQQPPQVKPEPANSAPAPPQQLPVTDTISKANSVNMPTNPLTGQPYVPGQG